MNTHTKFILRSDYVKKDGTRPICLRITVNRKVKLYSLNISCKDCDWNEKKSIVRASDPEVAQKNKIIALYKKKSRDIVFDFLVTGRILTLNEFERLFRSNIIDKSFYSFAEYEIEFNKNKFSYETIRFYRSHVTKLKKFMPELYFHDITIGFLKDYEHYMITELGNNPNTISKTMRFVKSIINKAIQAGIITENIFDRYKIKIYEGNRDFLTMAELQRLGNLLKYKGLKKNKKNVLKYFLFCCYTGLRYTDIKNLKFKNIQEDIISIEMHKTKKVVRIPLIEQAKSLVKPGFKEQKVFKVFAGQVTNRYLKEIIKLAGINKIISFHCSRHTFATNSLTLGIPIEVVSKLLGHESLKTTQIYAKVVDSVKIREMSKWKKIKYGISN